MIEIIWLRFFGVLGLLIISCAILMHNRKHQDIAYIIGGILLEVYSIYIGDFVFITLQLFFVAIATYDYFKRFVFKNDKK
jgi:hypothetical protein